MSGETIIRTWRGVVRTADADAYVAYVEATGLRAYRDTPGNEGAWMLRRDLGDDRTEVVTVSRWTSLDAIRAFAGDDVDRAVFFPDDDRFLVDRDRTVRHFALARDLG